MLCIGETLDFRRCKYGLLDWGTDSLSRSGARHRVYGSQLELFESLLLE